MADFYDSYDAFKDYSTPTLKPKHARRYDRDFWIPAAATADMRFLEIGCGTGLFLEYLRAKGVSDFFGIDLDPKVERVLPDGVKGRFAAGDVRDWLAGDGKDRTFDRIALFDVFEHFTFEDGRDLLITLSAHLAPGGRIVLRVPNGGSPWGAQHQNGDMTHLAAYAPNALRQIATATGYRCLSLYPHYIKEGRRKFTDTLVHKTLDWLLLEPPEVWTANLYAVLEWPGR